jgi:hypothetical protein
MVAKKTWMLVPIPDRRLVARVGERVREVATLRTLVDMQCNRYAIYREALLAESTFGLSVWRSAGG